MTVSELIAILKKQPKNLQVAYPLYSEYCLLEASDIAVGEACPLRPDGWIHRARPDQPTHPYLFLTGYC